MPGRVVAPPSTLHAHAPMFDATRTVSGFGLVDPPLRAVAEAAHEAIVMIDPGQTIVAMNPAALRMFRVSPGDVEGQPLSRLIPERHRARHDAFVREFDASGMTESRPMRRDPVVGRRWDGEEFPAEASISRVALVTGGRPQPLFVAVLRDLSVEAGLRRELDAGVQRLRTVLDLAPEPMWLVEGDRVTLANRAARQLVGADGLDDLVGESIFSLLDPPTHAAVRAHLARVLSGGTAAARVDAVVRRRDGDLRDVEIASAPLPDHGASVAQMIFTDVTERRDQMRAHERHRRELQRLSASVVDAREEERRRIARELHDELGQRLSAMKMTLAGLRATPAAAGDTHEPTLGGLMEMIDDTVAAVRRIAADLRPLMLDDLGLNAAIESLARDASWRLGVEVTVHMDDDDPPLGDAAAIALYRMVQEALTNVGRHARATDVRIDLRQRAGELVLVVQDNGVGFSDRALQHEGRYGLLGIRERALALGGRLEVDNAPGGGGRLTVRLPLGRLATEAEDGA